MTDSIFMGLDTPLGHYRIIHDPTPEHDMDGANVHLIRVYKDHGVIGNSFGIATYHPSLLPKHIIQEFRLNFGVEIQSLEAEYEIMREQKLIENF